ncbi:ATP-binding protein [Alteromonas sp. A081]|uniref:hybrid sensor histidine kinase/response regulator n=1 Tax=Alteromonas sp. A081 TaxID=3410269 RepID=UPI003B987E64
MLYKPGVLGEQSASFDDADFPEPIKYLIENVTDGVVIFDQRGRINYSNKSFQTMVGCSAIDINQLSLSDIDSQYCKEQFSSFFEYLSHSSGTVESRFIHKDNTTFPVQYSSFVTNLHNQPVALVIVKSINDDKTLAAELREFKSIVDKTTDCVFIFSQDSLNFTYINRGAENQIGYSLGELKTMHPYDIKPEFTEDEFRELVLPLIRNGGGTLNFDTVHQHKNGDLIDVSIVLQLVEGHSGEKQFVAIVRDISDYKKLQEKYRHSQKMEAIGRLAGGVAHDFNNQLAVILGYADLIAHHEASNDIIGYALRIADSAEVSKKLVEQLLIFSRKTDLQLATIDMHQLIREMEEFLSHTISKKITTSLSLASSSYHVVADRALMKTALLNLALNARDAMPDGGHIFIETERLPFAELKPDTFNEAIQITISDTGNGIPEDQLNKIFEPFYTTKDHGKGTGLGLSSVKGTIEQHGGVIDVSSNTTGHAAQGATFTVTLPVVALEHESSSPPIHAEQPQIASKGTILLIDDEPSVKEVCEEILKVLGYSVIAVDSGKEAIEIYAAQHHDIAMVIVDYMMPEMLGTEVLAQLRAIQPNVKAMISSGYLADTTVAELKSMGVLAVVRKPFSINDFREVLLKYVG